MRHSAIFEDEVDFQEHSVRRFWLWYWYWYVIGMHIIVECNGIDIGMQCYGIGIGIGNVIGMVWYGTAMVLVCI
jgi:hypothetical protein